MYGVRCTVLNVLLYYRMYVVRTHALHGSARAMLLMAVSADVPRTMYDALNTR